MTKFKDIFPGYMKPVVIVIISLVLSAFVPQDLMGQEDFSPSRVSAERLFNDGDYKQAYKHFDALLDLYPSDPLYKYYAGACLVETGDTSGESAVLLEEAMSAVNPLRPVPDDGWYYLGRAYQLKGEFEEAINSYDRFRDKVRKKELKAYNIDELIAQCSEPAADAEEPAVNRTEQVTELQAAKEEEDEIITLAAETTDSLKLPGVEKVEAGQVIAKQEISEQEEASADYDALAARALEYQFKADSLARLADRYRQTVKNLSGQDRQTISKKILELEEQTFTYQSMADKSLAEALKYNRMVFDGYKEEEPERNADMADEGREALLTVPDRAAVEVDNQERPDTTIEDKELIEPEPEPEPVLVMFDTDRAQEETIPINDSLPEGLFYRIQTAAFRNPVNPSHFKSLGPVYGLKAADSDITFYSIGFFRKKENADLALIKVRAEGFNDAFVIAQFEGRRISLERAMVLEKEWGNISLFDPLVVSKPAKPAEPVMLVFRVQVRLSEDELPDDEVETLRLVAGSRDFEILVNDNGEYVYLIGKFLTFESAASYSDLLYRNGLKEARVAAYLGVKEIPVEKAKELFDVNYNK